ncbi:exported hypothetical protein [Vibrio chagasii]|nr:exported hypothetical protein [Vibrio chagasii]
MDKFKFKFLIISAFTSTLSIGASASSLQCDEDEFVEFMDAYRAGIDSAANKQRASMDPAQWAEADFNRKMKEDPSNFCEVIAQADYRMSMPDWSKIQDAWNALMAMQITNAKGVDMSTIITEAIKKGYEKAKEQLTKGACKLAQASLDGAVAGIAASSENYQKYQEKRFDKWLNDRSLYQDYQMVSKEQYEKLAWKKIDDSEKEKKNKEKRKDINKFLGTKLL